MTQIQQAVAQWLGRQTGVKALAGRSPVQQYPMLTVEAELEGTTPMDGGRQCEERFSVTITAATDRDRDNSREMLSALALALPGGIPMDDRVLHPEEISTKGDTLQFFITLCRVRPLSNQQDAPQVMETLHFDV